jgi:hypothetical protein
MKLVENPAKVGRVLSIIVVVTIFIELINFLYYFLNSSGDQSTTLNSLVMYLGEAVIVGAVAFAVAISVANKQHRNNLQSSNDQKVQAPSDSVVVSGANEPVTSETDIAEK